MIDGTTPESSIVARIAKILKEKQSISLCLPSNPPLDAVAAALALQGALIKLGKSVSIACGTGVDPQFALAGQEKILNRLVADGDVLVVSIPYKSGNVDNVTYNVDGDMLNILITPEEGNPRLDPNSVGFTYAGGKPEVVVTIYAQSLESLGDLYETSKDQFTGVEIINIDRHFTNSEYGTVNFIDKRSPSMTQMINDILRIFKTEVDKDLATIMYDGLVAATNNFSSHAVNSQTFRMAAFLLEQGAMKRQGVAPVPVAPVAPAVAPAVAQPQARPAHVQTPPPAPVEPIPEDTEPVQAPVEPTTEPAQQLKPQIFKGTTSINKG